MLGRGTDSGYPDLQDYTLALYRASGDSLILGSVPERLFWL